eukprot:TRINITY_DN82303_c0_g1_i1.p1 TRINITY_DN82303_c0_g1~~TRINITY_DN82303_c0_g1_i1.p1  ORF type:complete len:776 (-),score=211.93 TRINITY_DN82303_c0_g1_i1:245-2572(-)
MGCSCSTSSALAASEPQSRKAAGKRPDRVHPAEDVAEALAAGGDMKLASGQDNSDASTAASSRSATPAEEEGRRQAQPAQPLPTWPRMMLQDAGAHSFMVYSVYSFLPWKQRGEVTAVSKGLRRFFRVNDNNSEYWRWLCRCLCKEAKLFLPSEAGVAYSRDDLRLLVNSNTGGFKQLLSELWSLRSQFAEAGGSAAPRKPERVNVTTFCRMRPAPPPSMDGAFCEMLLSAPLTLPLGQRVALLRQRHPELTRAQAMRMFLNKECGAAGPMDEGDDDLQSIIEVKPTQAQLDPSVARDAAATCGSGFTSSVLSVEPGREGSVLTVSGGIGIRTWDFHSVFDETSTQRGVYESCGLRLTVNLLNGQSGALVVYGQTGSGKTHTMFGSAHSTDGLIPRVADDVLAAMEARREQGFRMKLGVSIVEVFGNDISNLLGKETKAVSANLGQAQRMAHKYVLDGKFEQPVKSKQDFEDLLKRGEERKRKASTQMNERSTRAHTLVIMRLQQKAPGSEKIVSSVLSLVDLGGSERVSKSGAHESIRCAGGIMVGNEEQSRVSWQEYYRGRERITETNNINTGLLALKRCVQALHDRQAARSEGKPLPRVPFNDSKLTMLLQPALSGEASTSIVVCCSPEDRHAEETVQSLRFGEMCSAVQHDVKDQNAKDAVAAVSGALKKIDEQITEVEKEIRAKEKWEWRKSIRTDVIDEKDTVAVMCHSEEQMELGGFGVVEIAKDDGTSKKRTVEHEVWSQVLVGAEAENARREELLRQRQKLLGGGD